LDHGRAGVVSRVVGKPLGCHSTVALEGTVHVSVLLGSRVHHETGGGGSLSNTNLGVQREAVGGTVEGRVISGERGERLRLGRSVNRKRGLDPVAGRRWSPADTSAVLEVWDHLGFPVRPAELVVSGRGRRRRGRAWGRSRSWEGRGEPGVSLIPGRLSRNTSSKPPSSTGEPGHPIMRR
jgi:hypothetical protein